MAGPRLRAPCEMILHCHALRGRYFRRSERNGAWQSPGMDIATARHASEKPVSI